MKLNQKHSNLDRHPHLKMILSPILGPRNSPLR